MNPCVAVFMKIDTKDGFDVDVATRRVFLCSDLDGQKKFLQNALQKREQIGCIFINGQAPDGNFTISLPCTVNNVEKIAETVVNH